MAITIPAPPPKLDRKVSIRVRDAHWQQIEAIAARSGVSTALTVRHLLERCLSAEATASQG